MDRRFAEALFAGPLDIVGDVHGEFDALLALLARLGYDRHGEHPQGRRLVFVGDLCDRGPDSISVTAFVRDLVERDLAQCVLGNHELNVLRASRKDGNGWFFERDHDAASGKFTGWRCANADQREWITDFYAELPVTLERADLRVVHAAWHKEAAELLPTGASSTLAAYNSFADRLEADARASGLAARADAEEAAHYTAITDSSASVPLLEHSGRQDELYQMGNPLRVLTSGPERLTATPFFAQGKWRMLERVKWWDEYQHATPVIFGHYWRWPAPADYGVFGTWKLDLFAGAAPHEWLGQQRNAFCVDFSIGARYHERRSAPGASFKTRLGAVRWPERVLVTDDGSTRALIESR
jgi:hypothetical protein